MSNLSDKKTLVSKYNRYNDTLTSGSTYTGTPEINYNNQVMISILSSQPLEMYVDISPDNYNWNTYEYVIIENLFDHQVITCSLMYIRVRIINTSSNDSNIILNTYFGSFGTNNATQLSSNIPDNQQVITTKAVLHTQHLNGKYLPIQSYYNKAINCTVISPATAFGEMLTAQLSPYIQIQFSYYEGDITTNNNFDIYKNNSSSSKVRNSNLILTSGCNYGDYSILQSKKFIKYNSGQGILVRASALFSPPREGHQQAFGFGDKANGFYVYNDGNSITCLKRTNGTYEIRKVTLSGTTATSNGIITIILSGIPNYVRVTSGQTLIQIINNIVSNPIISWADVGWEVYQEGINLYFKSLQPTELSGTYSFTSTAIGITGSAITQISAGANYDEYIVSRSNWEDPCNNTIFIPTINFNLGNVYQMSFQWLGYGKISYGLENPVNGIFQNFHNIQYANNNGKPSINNPNGYIILGSQNTLSDKTATFLGTDINTILNTITISAGHTFENGELVCYDNSSTNGIVSTSYSKTFDGSSTSVVGTLGSNSLNISNHRFKNSEQVIYSSGGGTAITGLTNNTIYYVIYRNDDVIQLASSLANVSTYTSVSITGVGTGTNHSLSSFRYYINKVDDTTIQLKSHFNDVSAITLSATGTRLLKIHNCYTVNVDGSDGTVISGTNIIIPNHGLQNYEAVRYFNYSGGTDISGLTADELYYVSVIDDNTFSLTLYKGGDAISLNPGTGDEHHFTVMSSISSSSMGIFNEGNTLINKLQSYARDGRNTTITVNDEVPMFALFVKKEYNNKNNTIPIIINRFSFSYSKVSANDKDITAQFNVYVNPTFTTYNPANTFTDVESNVSVCSYSTLTSTDRITGGRNVYNTYTRLGGINAEPNHGIELQPGDLLVVTGKRTAATSIILDCNIAWYENL